jgi:hypothetical protein
MELPKEITDKISEETSFSEDRELATLGAEIAHAHYTPIIESQAKEIAELKEAQRWIPVGEKLPEVGGEYLVYREVRNEQFILAYEGGRFYYEGMAFKGVTHWQPLPAPPKE